MSDDANVAVLMNKTRRQLQEHLQSLKQELDDKDEENALKMKELQLSINELMERRAHRKRHLSGEKSLAFV